MRTSIVALVSSALVLAPIVVAASPGLRSIMHAWRADARTTHDMLYGRTTFDPAAVRQMLQTYAADAGSVAARVHGRTTSARDFQRRFVAFQADAQTALGDLGSGPSRRPALKADFARLTQACQACHDVFNN